MTKVTYLIGAGASALGVPPINKIPAKLAEFKKFMEDTIVNIEVVREIASRAGKKSASAIYPDILETISEILNNINSYTSIDSYAKELIDSGRDKKYNKLKAVTSFFIIYEQIKNQIDPRYRSFLINISGGFRGAFQGNIKVLSWNYDFQFEKAYSKIYEDNDIRKIQELLRIYPNDSPGYPRATDSFSIFKLNGTTSFSASNRQKLIHPIEDLSYEDLGQLPSIFFRYYFLNVYAGEAENVLSFAWETNNNKSRNTLDVAKLSIENTQVLVIIGYSFPDFNIPIDTELFDILTPGLKEIYIQDLDPQRVKNRVISLFLPEYEPLKFSLETINKDIPSDFVRPHQIFRK